MYVCIYVCSTYLCNYVYMLLGSMYAWYGMYAPKFSFISPNAPEFRILAPQIPSHSITVVRTGKTTTNDEKNAGKILAQ